MLTKEFAAVENGTISDAQLLRDAQGNIVAGTDTTAIAGEAILAQQCAVDRP